MLTLSVPVYAASGAINTNITRFQNLSGDAYYINCANGYSLDMEETGLLESGDAIIHSIANIIFAFIKWVGQIVTTLFYFCMDFDLTNLFGNEINVIQNTLNSGIFEPMFIIGFCGCAVILLKKMMKRDLMGAYGEILKVIGIFVLSLLVVRDSATVLSMTTNITKSISTQALVGMQDNGHITDTATYAANCAGTLWVNLVHQPWEFIEFGNDPVDENFVRLALTDNTYAPNSVNREAYIDAYTTGNAFSKERSGERAAFMILYLFPFLLKSAIYIVMAIISIAFQLISVFFVILAPVVLILAMFPGYEGILTSWLKKILESQLSILIMSFVIGLLIKVDDMLYTNCSGQWGWLIVMVVQVGLALAIVLKRDALLGALSKVQKAAANPYYANAMLRNGNTDAVSMSYKALNTSVRKGGHALMRSAEIGGSAAAFSIKGIKEYGQTVSEGTYAYKQAVVMEAAASYQIDTSPKAVERPVMKKSKEQAPSSQNASINAPEAQIATKQVGASNPNIIYVEPLNGRLERSENITRPNLWKEQDNTSVLESKQDNLGESVPTESLEYESIKSDQAVTEQVVIETVAVGATQGSRPVQTVQMHDKPMVPVKERNIDYVEQKNFYVEKRENDKEIPISEPVRPRINTVTSSIKSEAERIAENRAETGPVEIIREEKVIIEQVTVEKETAPQKGNQVIVKKEVIPKNAEQNMQIEIKNVEPPTQVKPTPQVKQIPQVKPSQQAKSKQEKPVRSHSTETKKTADTLKTVKNKIVQEIPGESINTRIRSDQAVKGKSVTRPKF